MLLLALNRSVCVATIAVRSLVAKTLVANFIAKVFPPIFIKRENLLHFFYQIFNEKKSVL